MAFLKLTAEGRCEGLRPAEIWKMQRGRKWIPEKNALWWRTCVWTCLRPAIHMVMGLPWLKFLILGLDTMWVCDCICSLPPSACLSIYLCLQSPSFTSSPLPPLSIPYSIDFALWQTAVAFDPNPVICLYCVLNMVADEISMHYCHPVADSSTSVCVCCPLWLQ